MSDDTSVDSAHNRNLGVIGQAIASFNSGNPDNHRQALQEKHMPLLEVENYIRFRANELDVKVEYDITAKESVDFQTINYTTYAGMLIMHPLNFELSMRQMLEAHSDNTPKGHVEFIKQKIVSDGGFSKYDFAKTDHFIGHKPVVVVLTGGNKLKKHCCVGKLKKIIETHGRENIIFKKHPISYDDVYQELSDYLGGVNYASAYTDLYSLMDKAEYVYTTMKSESALIANIMGKKVDHFDLYHNRHLGSFSHINNFIFTSDNPLEWANRSFGSYKSGVILPDVDKDWTDKVDRYLDYILKLRSFYSNSYVWG